MDQVLFDGLVSTAYSQLYLSSAPGALPPDPQIAFRGQRNGLCGAGADGALFLVIGTHTGEVPVRVVLASGEPEAGDWEEVVEVSFTPTTSDITLEGWGGMFGVELLLPMATYRAQWSGNGFEAGKRQDVATPDRPAPDRYELTLWPAPAAPDEVLRVTSEEARYWHDRGFPR